MKRKPSKGEAAFHGAISFAATCFEYILIFAPFFLKNLGREGATVVALLSVFVFSLAGLVNLFDNEKARRISRIAKRFEVLTVMSTICAAFAMIVSFAVIVGASQEMIASQSLAMSVTLVVLGVLLAPRALMELLLLVYYLSNVPFSGKSPTTPRSHLKESSGKASSAVKRDRDAYENLWESVILPAATNLTRQDGVSLRSTAKEDIWKSYVRLNKQVSSKFMESQDDRLDRHKVTACYIFAVTQAAPLDIEKRIEATDKNAALSNERLAVTVGCSVLANFINSAIDHIPNLTPEAKEKAKRQAAEGVKFPQLVGHGTYEGNLIDSLCHAHETGMYDVHMLAKLVFHWDHLILTDDTYYEALIGYYVDKSRKPLVDDA